MTELQNDPAIQKLIEFAKSKKVITFDDLNEFLPEEIVNSDKIEDVIVLLSANDIRLQDEIDAGKNLEDAFALVYPYDKTQGFLSM